MLTLKSGVESDQISMIVPQLIDDQRFVGCLVVGSKGDDQVLNDALEHASERFSVIQIQSTVGMHPSRRGIEPTSFGPNLVCCLLPPAVVDSVLGALPFGHHCELAG